MLLPRSLLVLLEKEIQPFDGNSLDWACGGSAFPLLVAFPIWIVRCLNVSLLISYGLRIQEREGSVSKFDMTILLRLVFHCDLGTRIEIRDYMLTGISVGQVTPRQIDTERPNAT
jgi:hypothetical protein